MTKQETRRKIRLHCDEAALIDKDSVIAKQLGSIMEGETENHIATYGAGCVGRVLLDVLKEYYPEISVDCFLDRAADEKPEYLGLPVYKPDTELLSREFKQNTLVILSCDVTEPEADGIVKHLKSCGFTKVIRNSFYFIGYYNDYYGNYDRKMFTDDTDDILSAYELMSDDHSNEIFYTTFRANALMDGTDRTVSIGMTQYFDVDVPFRTKYQSFVDCGAYTGDTYMELTEHHKPKQYFGFEPDMSNFNKLCATVREQKDKNCKAVLLPMGVSNKNEFVNFESPGLPNSRIAEQGSNSIQTVRLDDVLKGYNDLMIKMDIEGAETDALFGARHIITETKPDLAVCVYHKIEDLWQIPLMLKKWVPDYKFYLRKHKPHPVETVLYATV